MVDYARSSVPSSEWSKAVPIDLFTKADQFYAAKHVGADPWNTSGDRWVFNYGNQIDLDAQNRVRPDWLSFPNPNHEALSAWVPSTFQGVGTAYSQLNNYEERVDLCTMFNPYIADRHWPLLLSNQAFAGMYGHTSDSVKHRPNTHFAASDLISTNAGTDVLSAGATAIAYGRLHEGMDINWTYHDDHIDPRYRGVFGEIPDEYCYGNSILIGEDLQYPVACSSEYMNLCGSLAYSGSNPKTGEDHGDGGCNPFEREWERVKEGCDADALRRCRDTDTCGTLTEWCSKVWLGWFCESTCDVVACTAASVEDVTSCAKAGVQAFTEIAWAYLGGFFCAAITGQQCSEGQTVLRHRFDGSDKREIEIELEHRVAFGKTDGEDLCDEYVSFNGVCSATDYGQLNGVYRASTLGVPSIGFGGGCSHHVYVGKEFDPIGGYNTSQGSNGCVEGGFEGRVNPFVFAPGAMGRRAAWNERIATVTGSGFTTFNASTMSTRIVPQADSFVPDGWAFRLEFVGDLIIDCGHNPLRTEIHPPTNLLMHLSTPTMVHTKRYSVFGWNRQGRSAAAQFDLWPGPPPNGKSRLAHRILYPTGADLPPSGLVCSAYPTAAPNRVRCRVPIGDTAGDTDVCSNNQRMHPSCATSVGGGLVDVYWE
jgi:hypothetical protein